MFFAYLCPKGAQVLGGFWGAEGTDSPGLFLQKSRGVCGPAKGGVCIPRVSETLC